MEVSHGSDAYGGRGPELLGVSWMLTVITTIIILLRLYVRSFVVESTSNYKDSWSLLWSATAWLFGVLGTIIVSVATHYGYGNHISTVLAQGNLSKATLYTWIWLTFNTLMVLWAKFSLVAYLFEIQVSSGHAQRVTIITLMVISLCTNIVNVFLIWFQCDPSEALWKTDRYSDCQLKDVNYHYSLFSGSWGALVDLCLAMYPLYIICKYQVSGRAKLGLGCLLGLGVFACVCACMKTYELKVVQTAVDKTWHGVPWLLWSTAETWIILIACNVAPLGPLFGLEINPNSHNRLSSRTTSEREEKDGQGVEGLNSNRTSARSNTTTVTDATAVSNALTLSDSCAGQALDGAIAVKREVTIDREARRSYHGMRPRADTRSWARADSFGLARWSSSQAQSPVWAKSPSWRKPSIS